jgi:hypothetical protein
LQLGTFNEHIAQPQPNPYAAWVRSLGLELDSMGGSLWVDMYGDAATRDMEPTVEDGGTAWDLLRSCMRVLRSGAPACTTASEPCCVVDAEASWVNVWSMSTAAPELGGSGGGDRLLTTDENERSVLLNGGWHEVCSAAGGATAFCFWDGDSNALAPTAAAYTAGPFLAYARPVGNGTTPVYRCFGSGRHFISADAACFGSGVVESTLGHASKARSSNTPRSLRLCGGNGTYVHSLDSKCQAGSSQLEFIGFVH